MNEETVYERMFKNFLALKRDKDFDRRFVSGYLFALRQLRSACGGRDSRAYRRKTLRICLSVYNRKGELEKARKCLREIEETYGPRLRGEL